MINGKCVKNIDLLGKYFHTVINLKAFKSRYNKLKSRLDIKQIKKLYFDKTN